MYNFIANYNIHILGTSNAKFLALSHARLTICSTGDKQGWRKNDDLPQRFVFLHNGKQINKLLVFMCSYLAFSSYRPVLVWLYSTHCFVLCLRIKYDDSKNRKNVLWDQFQSWFWFDQKYTWLVSCWFDQKNMWQVICPLYLTGINLIFWLFLCEWCHTKINVNKKCCNVIFHENNFINGCDMIKKFQKPNNVLELTVINKRHCMSLWD